MRWTRDTPTDEGVGSRAAKTCGPDIPTLMSSWRQCLLIALMMVANKPGSPGRARHRPLKPFACGNAGCSGGLVVANSCAFLLSHARLRVRWASGIPHALFGRKFWVSPGADASRGGRGVSASCVIPGLAKRELWCAIAHLRIHGAARTLGEMDSGSGPSDHPGMTVESGNRTNSRSDRDRAGRSVTALTQVSVRFV